MQHVCLQCPRACGVERSAEQPGFCGVPLNFVVSRAALHRFEEPPISGTRGSGTIFFGGCNLRCVFCQNREISRGGVGREIDDNTLLSLMLRLRDEGAHNINLVTPTHYAAQLVPVLTRAKPLLGIPIVYNCGGYENPETLKQLDGLVDIYLPDFKYRSSDLSKKYSAAPDYCAVALTALEEMLRQTQTSIFSEDGLMKRGVLVRHLVLPGARKDSIDVLRLLASRFGTHSFRISVMSQYTPSFAKDVPYPELHRRVTSFEYESVTKEAEALGFEGYFQSRASATELYTPDFHELTF